MEIASEHRKTREVSPCSEPRWLAARLSRNRCYRSPSIKQISGRGATSDRLKDHALRRDLGAVREAIRISPRSIIPQISISSLLRSATEVPKCSPTRSQQIRIRCQRGDDLIELHGYGRRALDETATVFGTVPQFFWNRNGRGEAICAVPVRVRVK